MVETGFETPSSHVSKSQMLSAGILLCLASFHRAQVPLHH
ncbi:unnamed protein product [Tetraodon nigroviridis]|uniref:(spotted green pufferfish) hypothetical protein n=1 Tax=Tetraodon nigroviridis TaxID=99883 RepID=Q4T4G1_TETNG|nr:unnamed protein product [Tetraodon nigroviridis]